MSRKNIRGEIIHTARKLFNQRGYGNVSMRDIADALSISVGNLTYHYAKKEDLIEAVVQDMFSYYQPPVVPANLQEMNAMFARFQNTIQENAFYFWHYTQLSELSPSIHNHQTKIVLAQQERWRAAFTSFAAAGLMRDEEYPGQFRQLAQAVQILCIYWVPQSKLEEGLDTPKDFLACVWSVILPALTEEGQRIYHEKILQVRVEYEQPPAPYL